MSELSHTHNCNAARSFYLNQIEFYRKKAAAFDAIMYIHEDRAICYCCNEFDYDYHECVICDRVVCGVCAILLETDTRLLPRKYDTEAYCKSCGYCVADILEIEIKHKN